jgi:hypothetical protein
MNNNIIELSAMRAARAASSRRARGRSTTFGATCLALPIAEQYRRRKSESDRCMGQHQHDIDELARMERTCLELAAGAAMPEERAGLEIVAGNYRAETSRSMQFLPYARAQYF